MSVTLKERHHVSLDFANAWERQRKFTGKIYSMRNLTDAKREAMTKNLSLCLFSEVDELLNCINWKKHAKHFKINESNVKEELVDIFKYFVTVCIVWGVSPEELLEEFHRKSAVVEQRFIQDKELSLLRNEKVVGVDIDGVLADYPKCFIDFVNSNYSKDFKSYNELKSKTSLSKLEKYKWFYRESGVKRVLPLVYAAKEFLRELKKRGYTIVLLSARPYDKHNRIFADTIHWLKRNGLRYDAIIWSQDKGLKIVEEFPKVRFVVEDNRLIANELSSKGYKVYLLSSEYNYGELESNVVRVNDLFEVLRHEWEPKRNK